MRRELSGEDLLRLAGFAISPSGKMVRVTLSSGRILAVPIRTCGIYTDDKVVTLTPEDGVRVEGFEIGLLTWSPAYRSKLWQATLIDRLASEQEDKLGVEVAPA